MARRARRRSYETRSTPICETASTGRRNEKAAYPGGFLIDKRLYGYQQNRDTSAPVESNNAPQSPPLFQMA